MAFQLTSQLGGGGGGVVKKSDKIKIIESSSFCIS